MTFVGLFSPVTRLLPSAASQSAGASAWLGPLLAFPAALLFLAFLAAVKKRCREGEGLAELTVRLAGPRLGGVFNAASAAWMTAYCGFILRSGAERVVSTVYPNAHAAPFLVISAAVCAVAACGELRWRVRSARIFFPVLALTMGAILIFSLPNVRPGRVWPPDLTNAKGTALAALQSFNVMTTSAYGAFAFGGVNSSRGDFRRASVWAAAAALVTALTLFSVVGVLGPELASHVQIPFFAMIRSVSSFRLIDRAEPLVAALWMITDYVFASMLLSSAVAALGPNNKRIKTVCIAAAALAFSFLVSRDAFSFSRAARKAVPAVNLAYTAGLVPAVFLVGLTIKKKRDKKGQKR